MRTAQQYMALLKLSSCMMRIETPDFILWIYGLRIVQTSTQLAIRYHAETHHSDLNETAVDSVQRNSDKDC